MGFNIAGMVINSNYDHEISKLEKDLHMGFEVVRETTFEEAASNWKDDGLYYIYFGDKGTMIFFGHEMAIDRGLSQHHESMSYAYSATAMAFYISYNNVADSGYREIMESEDGRTMNEGNPLPLEAENPTADGLTFALMDKIMEQNWHAIDFGEKCYVCRAQRFTTRPTTPDTSIVDHTTSDESKIVKVATPEPLMQSKKRDAIKNVPTPTKKKWWQFWK